MKGKLEFNLDDFDELMAFRAAIKAQDMAMVLFEIVNNMQRRFRKIDGYDEEQLFKDIEDLMNEHGIIIDDYIR